jgi:hypothetical protein
MHEWHKHGGNILGEITKLRYYLFVIKMELEDEELVP